MANRAFTMVMASFAADSLALGAHWVYDTEAIETHLGRVDTLLKPLTNSYHSTKELGDFTHYGDQMFVLLESLAAHKGFSLADFSARWKALFNHYNGYLDEATQGTLVGYESGKGFKDGGSPSDDLAGAARISPLVFTYSDHLENLQTLSTLMPIWAKRKIELGDLPPGSPCCPTSNSWKKPADCSYRIIFKYNRISWELCILLFIWNPYS